MFHFCKVSRMHRWVKVKSFHWCLHSVTTAVTSPSRPDLFPLSQNPPLSPAQRPERHSRDPATIFPLMSPPGWKPWVTVLRRVLTWSSSTARQSRWEGGRGALGSLGPRQADVLVPCRISCRSSFCASYYISTLLASRFGWDYSVSWLWEILPAGPSVWCALPLLIYVDNYSFTIRSNIVPQDLSHCLFFNTRLYFQIMDPPPHTWGTCRKRGGSDSSLSP